MSPGPPPILVVEHVAWEGPHRIDDALAALPLLRVAMPDVGSSAPVSETARAAALPPPGEVSGAVFMGGPMSVHDTDRFPTLATEIGWMAEALDREVPVLGVCLGAQLLARALGADVRPAPAPEIGWGSVDVLDPDDPVVGPLAPATEVLHWHGEVFDLPATATPLARSAATAVQAFRAGRSAWGLLFHAEGDARLVERWLAEPRMAAEAEQALGPGHAGLLRDGALRAERDLVERSTQGFEAFAGHCRAYGGR